LLSQVKKLGNGRLQVAYCAADLSTWVEIGESEMKERAVAEDLEESGHRRRRRNLVPARVRRAGVAMVALPLAVSVFTAAPASAGAVTTNPGIGPQDYYQEIGANLPWWFDLGGIAGSTGNIGGKAFFHSGPYGTQTGVIGTLQQSTHIGPAYFNLDVVKSATFTYVPGTPATPGGHGPCDHPGHGGTAATGPKAALNLVDIGVWSAGIPGFVEWYGKLGFTSDTLVDENGVSFNWKGVNKQYVSIGGGLLTFGFDFQPSFSFHVPTPGVNLAAPLAPILAPGSTPAGLAPAQEAKSGHDAKRGYDVDAAGYEGVKPGQEGVTPGEGGGTPGAEGGTPGAEGGKPGAEGGGTPGAEGGKPGAEGGGTPGAEGGGTPGAEGGKPGAEGGGTPGAEGGQPGAEGGQPGAEGGNNGQSRNGDKPGENNRDKPGQAGSKPGGNGSGQGGDKAGADAK
jgi:hypothetical protein